MKDRTYYRQMDDIYLIEEGKSSDHELCIVLAERLEDAISLDEQLADQQELINDLRREMDSLREELEEMRTKKH
jgi:hypothetical protein